MAARFQVGKERRRFAIISRILRRNGKTTAGPSFSQGALPLKDTGQKTLLSEFGISQISTLYCLKTIILKLLPLAKGKRRHQIQHSAQCHDRSKAVNVLSKMQNTLKTMSWIRKDKMPCRNPSKNTLIHTPPETTMASAMASRTHSK